MLDQENHLARTAQTRPINVLVCKDAQRLTEITNRRGKVEDFVSENAQEWLELGVRYDDVDAVSDDLLEIWRDEVSCLVFDAKDNTVKIEVEAFLNEDHLPREWISDTTAGDGANLWRYGLGVHAPWIAHVCNSISAMNDPDAPGIECIINLYQQRYASMRILMPLEASNLYEPVARLLFDHSLGMPPSAHEQMTALAALRWRYDPAEISPLALPGLHLPI